MVNEYEFVPVLCAQCKHEHKFHLDENSGACSVPIEINEDFVEECTCAGFKWEKVTE